MGASVAWLPPPLALALLVGCTLMVMACAGVLWLGMRLAGRRTTQAALTGAMLGPIAAVGASGPLRLLVGTPWGGPLAGLVGGGLLLGLGPAGARWTEGRERSRPASPGLTWAGAALLLAALGQGLQGGSPWVAAAAALVGIALGGIGLLGRLPRRQPASSGGRGRLLLTLVVSACIVPFWPWLLPWLLFDENLPEVGAWPPSFLFVALKDHREPQSGASEGAPLPTLEIIAAGSLTYPELTPEPEVASLLRLPDGSPLGAQLHAAGYATAAILSTPDPGFAEGMGIEETDDRPGGRSRLAQSAAWMAAAPLLLARASPLLSLLGQDQGLRSPEQLAEAAARWLLGWRTTRAPAPFFLLVDLRAPDATPAAVERGLQILLDRVDELGLGFSTILILVVERSSGDSGSALRALVAPPFSWSGAPRRETAEPIWGRLLGLALLQIALSDGETPVTLPGLPRPLSPPQPLPQP